MAKNYFDFRYDFSNTDWVPNIINDVAGIESDNAMIQIILMRLLIPKGQYILNPEIGSDLHTLSRRKVTAITTQVVNDMILNALQSEFDNGNIESAKVSSITKDNDRIIIAVKIKITDTDPVDINLKLNL